MDRLGVKPLERQGGVGAAEAKAVGKDAVEGQSVLTLEDNGHVLEFGVGITDVRRGDYKAVLQH